MIHVKNAPHIAGLRFRHFRGERDYPHLAAVLNASEAADQVERNVTAEAIAKAFGQLVNCDPYKDMILAEVAGELVGYVRGEWGDKNTGRGYEHIGYLIPQWRRKGIGGAMLAWMENRLFEIASAHPKEEAKFFQVAVTQHQTGTAILLERAGYRAVRYFFEMVRPTLEDIPASPLPDGLELRPVTPDHYPAIWKATDETSREEWGYRESAEGEYEEWQRSPRFQPHLWQIAWDAATDEVVGHVLTFIDEERNEQFNRKRGYTEGIGVDQRWRRRGVARALIARSLQAQKEAGMTESALIADSANASRATSLYESCGFQVVKRITIYRKPFIVI
jgi:ribosomal protein S18 acetylase RimI-like enzyme